MTITDNEAVEIVHAALTHAASGDTDGGAELLTPLLTGGPGTQYILACMLAQVVSHTGRRDEAPDASGPVEAMSPEDAFAHRFIKAWSAGDHGRAEDHFAALYRQSTGAGMQLRDGLLALFRMAAVTCTDMQAAHTTGEEPVLWPPQPLPSSHPRSPRPTTTPRSSSLPSTASRASPSPRRGSR